MKKADLLLHPVRMRIIQQLLMEESQTILQLAEALGDVPQATLYRHMKLMLEAQLIEVVQINKIHGQEERVYAAVKENLSISGSEAYSASQEEHMRYFSIFHANLLQQATTYLSKTSAEHYETDGFGYWNAPLHMSDEEFASFVSGINELLEQVAANKPTPERKTRLFASMMIPLLQNQQVKESNDEY
ncbi:MULTISPECIES: helix-turn-helix domain-containing protein [Shouchella]|nr:MULTISPECIES: helix-turn-helix domain-containing protein [Shouchella]MBU8597542.1 helix-turn-helix domain-containing protein [Shouchella clausii]MEB5481346.1 helix-turn-helix domain-containing protein [Shouchella clausii]MED4156947.1 helix-turn-helix domain-containing protein [Shouchella clausii]MED4175457.1 helix-turn-helix domain-containing protein [Shouchella clausii]GIN10321.1 transcriptional regulator [Shouchella clausii]